MDNFEMSAPSENWRSAPPASDEFPFGHTQVPVNSQMAIGALVAGLVFLGLVVCGGVYGYCRRRNRNAILVLPYHATPGLPPNVQYSTAPLPYASLAPGTIIHIETGNFLDSMNRLSVQRVRTSGRVDLTEIVNPEQIVGAPVAPFVQVPAGVLVHNGIILCAGAHSHLHTSGESVDPLPRYEGPPEYRSKDMQSPPPSY